MREIETRLRRVCQDLTEQEFRDLVHDIAETKLEFLTQDRERCLGTPITRGRARPQSTRPPGLAQAIGSLPRPPRPPVAPQPRQDEARPS